MCGIVGAVSKRNVTAILMDGLKRLEYRGYDSAGIAVFQKKSGLLQTYRVKGKVSALAAQIAKKPLIGNTGIAHTRWATHGEPSKRNAHPILSDHAVAIVHNGIIENYEALREQLTQAGYEFLSETDTEVVAHLIHHHVKKSKDFLTAIHKATKELVGAYGLAILNMNEPHTIYGVRSGSPLVIGLGEQENFIASDPLALLPVTQHFIYLKEGDIVKIENDHCAIFDKNLKPVKRPSQLTDLKADTASKGNYQHYMQKEIFEQPQAIIDTINGHLNDDHITTQTFGHQAQKIFPTIKRVQLVACGSSYNAALVGRYWLEGFARIPCDVDIASEHRYRDAVVAPDTLFVALSQSGETADTLAAVRQAKKDGYAATLGICNVAQSSLAREVDMIFLTRAGAEIGVAATKTFTTQLAALLLLALGLQQTKTPTATKALIKTLKQLPRFLEETLTLDKSIKKLAERFVDKQHVLFLGRGAMYPIALEGALKLKEISYLHAEAYPAGELKHGPLALVDKGMPVVIIAPNNALFKKLASNMKEVEARGGELILFLDKTLSKESRKNNLTIRMPSVPDIVTPIVYTLPLQLLAYHVAALKGTDVDQPRHLAKSVTVE